MTTHVVTGHLNLCAVAALCFGALGTAPVAALQTDASDMVHDTWEVDELVAIDGSGEQIYINFNAPLDHLIASLLRTSSYEWPYRSFETLLKKHGRSKVRAAIAEHLRAMADLALRETHKGASGDPMSPLSDLRLPHDMWLQK